MKSDIRTRKLLESNRYIINIANYRVDVTNTFILVLIILVKPFNLVDYLSLSNGYVILVSIQCSHSII